MTRNIKALGLAFVAVAAMSMAAASMAYASELHVTTSANKATITGQQIEQFKFQITHPNGPSTTCTTVSFEATVERTPQQPAGPQLTEQELTLTPTVSGCQAFGLGAQVRVHGCKITLTNKSGTGTNHTTALTAWVDITGCTAGKQMEVLAPGCTFTVPQQHHLSHLIKSNEGISPHDVRANVTMSGVQYELHGAFCGHATTVPTSDGTLTGQATFRAFEDPNPPTLVTEHEHQFLKHKHNNVQLGLLAT